MILGRSGVKRQIDISIRYNLGQFDLLAIIDCKDWSKPVDIGDVGTFIDLVEDAAANKGAIICNAGFTEGAKKRAYEKGIDLFMAVDAANLDWPVYISFPTLCDFRYIKSCKFRFRHCVSNQFAIPACDSRYIEIYKKNGIFQDILMNLFVKAWDNGKFPAEIGEHINLNFLEEDAYTKVNDKLYGPIEITTTIIIGKKLFFGHIPIQKGKGFINNLTGEFITRNMEVSIDVFEVEQKWRRLSSENELAVKPLMTFLAGRNSGDTILNS